MNEQRGGSTNQFFKRNDVFSTKKEETEISSSPNSADIKNQPPKERTREADSMGRSFASGGRKESIATVIISPGGSGKVVVNKKDVSELFPRDYHLSNILRPLSICGNAFDVVAKVSGGGKSGQADAIKLAISRAMVKQNPTLYPSLRREGLMTRDPRKIEPKKTGQPKSRKNKPTSRR